MTKSRATYHHGGLREALIDAALTLVEENGAESFTLKDASKRAGVSVAAPYRHFADKGDLLYHVAELGFERLRVETTAERDKHPRGTVDGLIAMGKEYVGFAGRYPHLFRLMFSNHSVYEGTNQAGNAPNGALSTTAKAALAADDLSSVSDDLSRDGASEDGFQEFLATIRAIIQAMGGHENDLMRLAMPLWSLVHGTASLYIDQGFAHKAPGTVTDDVITTATDFMFSGYATELNSRKRMVS